MIGKIVPYIGVGFVQVTVILVAARAAVRRADGRPAATLLLAGTLLFIAANLTLGYLLDASPATRCRRCR